MNTTSRTSLSSSSILSVAANLLTRWLGGGASRNRAATPAPRLLLGPIAGLGSDRRRAPAQLAVPQGAELSFEFRWDVPHDVEWRGVRPLTRHGSVDRAEIELGRIGRRRIEVTASSLDGRRVYAWTVEVDVVATVASEAA